MFTVPVGPVKVFFYWPEAVFWNFYWPGAIGSPLASSPVINITPTNVFSQSDINIKVPLFKIAADIKRKHAITIFL